MASYRVVLIGQHRLELPVLLIFFPILIAFIYFMGKVEIRCKGTDSVVST